MNTSRGSKTSTCTATIGRGVWDVTDEGADLMLRQINEARSEAGLRPLRLSNNIAARHHAYDMCHNIFRSHWGSDGTTPVMRYSLHGGYQYSRSWVTGLNHQRRATPVDQSTDMAEPQTAMVDSLVRPTKGSSIALNPHWSYVNAGIAASSDSGIWIALQFETNYLEFYESPHIDRGFLKFDAQPINGARFSARWHLARVNYLPTPHALTRAQLVMASGSDAGRPIMSIMKPDAVGKRYQEGSYIVDQSVGVNPYDIDSSYELPASPNEVASIARDLADKASGLKEAWNVRRQNADVRLSDDGRLWASIRFRDALNRFREGVYVVTIWGVHGNDDAIIPLSEHAIFVPPRSLAG